MKKTTLSSYSTQRRQRQQEPMPFACLGQLIITACIVLVIRNVWFSAEHPWWLITVLFFLVAPAMFIIQTEIKKKYDPPSDEAIEQAFTNVQREQLRTMAFLFPAEWKYRKLGTGSHAFTVKECGHLAIIGIDLEYLNATDINTFEGYLAYAVDFAKSQKSKILLNKLTKRWGMCVHEVVYESPSTFGHRVTIPYHGTEYGIQLQTNDSQMIPAARRLFEMFLKTIQFQAPDLPLHSGFGGTLQVGLPPEFVPTGCQTPDKLIWTSKLRNNCYLEISRLETEQTEMSPMLLEPVVDRCPKPDEARRDVLYKMSFKQFTTLAENGFGGFIYNQATNNKSFVAAVGDLPTGGRYLFCLDDRAPRQEPYLEHYHYLQMAYEILVTLSEKA